MSCSMGSCSMTPSQVCRNQSSDLRGIELVGAVGRSLLFFSTRAGVTSTRDLFHLSLRIHGHTSSPCLSQPRGEPGHAGSLPTLDSALMGYFLASLVV